MLILDRPNQAEQPTQETERLPWMGGAWFVLTVATDS